MNSELPSDCGFYLKMISELLDRRINYSLKSRQLTSTQFKILHYLAQQPGGSASLKELKAHFCLAQSTMHGLADRLEQKGFVAAWYAEGNKHAKQIRITSEGLRLDLECHQDLQRDKPRLFSALSEEEQLALLDYLQRIYLLLTSELDAPDSEGDSLP